MRTLQIAPANGSEIGRKYTPGQKMGVVNTNVGNRQAVNQQGTSRQLYDAIALDGRTLFEFFFNVAGKVFPFSNINENKLKTGESFALQRCYFAVQTHDATSGAFTNILTLTTAARTALYGSDFTIVWDTQLVMKPYPLASAFPAFNHSSMNATNETIYFDSETILPPDISWQLNLRTPAYTALANAFLRCNLEGFGTLLSAKTQF